MEDKILEIVNTYTNNDLLYIGFGLVVVPPSKSYTEGNLTITNNRNSNLLLTGCSYD